MANGERQYVVEYRMRGASEVEVSRFSTFEDATEFVDTYGRSHEEPVINPATGKVMGYRLVKRGLWDYFIQFARGGIIHAPNYD